MITEQEFLALLKRPESYTLDFKSQAYRTTEEWGQAALIKDVLCMANTPREETSYIVLGVAKHPDNSFDLVGLPKQLDGNDLQTQFVDRVHPVPTFSYVPINHAGKNFGVIAIPPVPQGPCMLRT